MEHLIMNIVFIIIGYKLIRWSLPNFYSVYRRYSNKMIYSNTLVEQFAINTVIILLGVFMITINIHTIYGYFNPPEIVNDVDLILDYINKNKG